MLKLIVALIISGILTMCSTNVLCEADFVNTNKISSIDIDEITISVNITPIKDSKYCYSFITSTRSEISYILHILNSMKMIDDEKIINGGDISIININITNKNGFIEKIGFIAGRFYDINNKQYAIDKNEYNQFLDFIYALKIKSIILDEDITFEPSEWSKKDIEEAVDEGLVPKLNQINYKGKINRLEVCQLIYNMLEKCNLIDSNKINNPFSDISDKSVISLYSLGIIDGKTDSGFYPYDNITREEFAKILSKANYLMNKDVQSSNNNYQYVDQEEISDWALEYVNTMHSLNIMTGNESNEFRPKDSITKEEVILTLLRISRQTGL